MSVYVSIGRNIRSTPWPMPESRWATFTKAVTLAVAEFAGPVVSVAFGRGEYNGVEEETCIVVGASDDSASTEYQRHNALSIALRALAREYEQECIAVAVATPQFLAGE